MQHYHLMKESTKKYFIKAFIAVLFLLISLSSLFAQEKTSLAPKRWKASFSVSSLYDNNILKYSEKYLKRFENKEDEGRFHINHSDDFIIQGKADISYSIDFIKNRSTTINLSADYNRYLNNTIKNWGIVEIGLNQEISKPLSLDIHYSFIPDFYVRHYRDADWVNRLGYTPEAFKGFSFSKEDLGTVLAYKIDNDTRVRGIFSYLRYIHNSNFTEYDCNNFEYGLRINRNITSLLSIDLGYLFTVSRTTRREEIIEINNQLEYADASNDEHNINGGISYSLPKIFKKENGISLRFQFSRSKYLSSIILEKDPLHSGRIDNDYRLSFRYSFNFDKNLSAGLLINWMKRVTDSEHSFNKETIAAEKDYDQIQAGINFVYKLSF